MRILFIAFLLFLSAATVFARKAQQQDTLLRVIAFNTTEKVQLKWIPANYEVWIEGMKKGYLIDRYEMQQVAGKWNLIAKETLTKEPIKAWEEQRIRTALETDPDMKNGALILAGLDLNDKAKIDGSQQGAALRSNKDFAFVMALLSQLMKNKTSEAMGSYFEDKTAQPGKTYLYRVSMAGNSKLKADAVVGRNAVTPLPTIAGFKSSSIHKAVELFWLNPKNSGYIYYDIYRSESKKGTFTKVNDLPFIGEVGIATDSKRMKYTDSLPQLDRLYYYKVVGVNAFEKESQPTAILEVKPVYFLQEAPEVVRAVSSNNKDIYVSWKVSAQEKPFVKSFAVYSSSKAVGPYKKISSKTIEGNTYEYLDARNGKGAFNYYSICAFGASGDSACSISKEVFLVDSIAPAPPVVFYSVCDTNGVVTLKWKKGPEADLKGFRVFRTYYKHKEPTRLTINYSKDTVFIDSVDIKKNWRKVYYGISSIDQLFNSSAMCQYVEVAMPDFNPPVNAIFKEYDMDRKGISLKWIPSSSEDIKTQHLLRKSEFDFSWQPFMTFSGDSLKVTEVVDSLTKSNIWYEYVLVAEDSSGLKSEPSKSVRVFQADKSASPVVTNLQTFVSRENQVIKLTWDFEMNATGFKIMRSKEGEPVQTYKFVPGSKREYYDKWLTPNTEYTYAIIAEIPNNRQSQMSKKVVAKY